jgi:hypothetical protein
VSEILRKVPTSCGRRRRSVAPLVKVFQKAVAAAAYEFITCPLLADPRRIGERLLPPMDDRFSARRGTYRLSTGSTISPGLPNLSIAQFPRCRIDLVYFYQGGACGAASGVPRAGLSLEEAPPARPRRPGRAVSADLPCSSSSRSVPYIAASLFAVDRPGRGHRRQERLP